MILRHSILFTLLTALAAFTGPPPATTALWYDLGHRVVADIAEQRLTPEAARAVRDILGGQRLSDASVWADNIKQYRHDADPLHYVNIPLGATAYDASETARTGSASSPRSPATGRCSPIPRRRCSTGPRRYGF